MDLKEEQALNGDPIRHWYYHSKARAVRQLIGAIKPASLLDVGAGSGVFSRYLLDAGVVMRAVCLDIGYPEDVLSSSERAGMSFVRSTDNREFGLVLMIDVLEHVDDDVALVKKYTEGLAAGTPVVVTVPAFAFLWSGHDDYLGHKRRYTLGQLRQVLEISGLEVVDGRYFFALALPVAMLKRLAERLFMRRQPAVAKSDLRSHSGIVNAALKSLLDIERRLLFPFNRMAGLTVCCLARVPGERPSSC
jgi:2-polyprenyl-3-methyl-5-hydroxy-6-metoxy-1,4-benzoquinol methylase